jgi:hypothetical protein
LVAGESAYVTISGPYFQRVTVLAGPLNSFELDLAPAPTPLSGIPEPSTWAMLLLGFAGLGFVGYRRAKRGSASLAA